MVLLPREEEAVAAAGAAVAPVDNRVGRRGKRVKKLFGHMSTSIEVKATATHNGNQMWTMPSMVRVAISVPNNRLLPPRLKIKP